MILKLLPQTNAIHSLIFAKKDCKFVNHCMYNLLQSDNFYSNVIKVSVKLRKSHFIHNDNAIMGVKSSIVFLAIK